MTIGRASRTRLAYHGNVCIAGLTASGKTTHAYMLAGCFGLTYVSGSQLHLAINGLAGVQDRAFWLTEEAGRLLSEAQFRSVDQRLVQIEGDHRGCVFDSWIMPWRRSTEGLSIYLMSSLESRAMKGAVSRRENGFLISDEYVEAIKGKDDTAVQLYKTVNAVDIENDLSVFDVIIDITTFITAPTFESSRSSILKTHAILEAVVGYYLTGKAHFRRRLQQHDGKQYMVRNTLSS